MGHRLELLVLIALMISLGGLFRFWLSPWGVLLVAKAWYARIRPPMPSRAG